MPELSVPWGQGELAFSLPEQWTVQQTALPSLKAAGDHWVDRLGTAISQPVAGPPLGKLLAARRRSGRIVIVVEDHTRHSPVEKMLEAVLRELHHSRVPDANVEIVFATGMHPPMTEQEIRDKLGSIADYPISRRCNPWHDAAAYENIGRIGRVDLHIDRKVADADLRIVLSSVSPHLQAGFGGGYKMFFPGCCHIDAVRAMHRLGVFRRPRQLVGAGADRNPMRATIDAAGRIVDARKGKTFVIEYLLDGQNRPTFIAAGEPAATHEMLTKQCAVACGIVPDGPPADVLITNAHPRDLDLWQCFKCIPNTRWAVRPNGVIICLARCPEGLREMKLMPWPLSPAWTRRMIRWLGPSTICSLVDRLVTRIAGDSAWFLRLATATIERNPVFMVSPQLVSEGVSFPGIATFATVEAAAAAATELLGDKPQRVAVYPWGGLSYPIIRD